MDRQRDAAGPGPIRLEENLDLSEVRAITSPEMIKQALEHPDTPSNDLAQEFFRRAGQEDPGFSN